MCTPEARFYDANNRTWLAMDPVKDGLNWYQYCYSNPTTYWDPLGLWTKVDSNSEFVQFSGSGNEVYLLLNLDGAMNFGHMAILIVNSVGQGLFYSYMGTDSIWNTYSGKPSISTLGEVQGTPKEVRALLRTGEIQFKYDEFNNKGKLMALQVHDNYDRSLSKNITSEEIEKMLDVTPEYRKKDYKLTTNNCGTFAMDVIGAIDTKAEGARRYAAPDEQYMHLRKQLTNEWEEAYIGEDTIVEIAIDAHYNTQISPGNSIYPIIP